jgi:hypothetical protein
VGNEFSFKVLKKDGTTAMICKGTVAGDKMKLSIATFPREIIGRRSLFARRGAKDRSLTRPMASEQYNGALFRLVSVRVSLPETALKSASIRCNVEIELAGETAKYKEVVLQAVTKGSATRITGSIPVKACRRRRFFTSAWRPSRIFIKSSDTPSKLRSSEPINWSHHRSCENSAKRTHIAREILCKVISRRLIAGGLRILLGAARNSPPQAGALLRPRDRSRHIIRAQGYRGR